MPKKILPEPDTVDEIGCLVITLEGVNYTLRPSFEAIIAIEHATGKSLFDLAGEASRSCLSVADMTIIICEMWHAYGKTLLNDNPMANTYRHAKPEIVGPLLYQYGLPRVNTRLALVLMGALMGGYTPSGEPKATGND